MEQFKKITIDDREILAKYLNKNPHRACDYSVGNLVLWSEVNNIQFAVAEDTLFIKFMIGEENNFLFPMGNFPKGDGDLKKSFEWIFEYCKEQNIKFKMNIIEPDMFHEIEKLYPGEFEISYIRDNADYVYEIEDLKNLSGKKYHGKKNHINKFLKTNENWAYERITDENSEECINMVKEWCVENKCCADKEKAAEICVLIKGLKYRKELGLLGGLIRIDGRIVAMTLGEKSGDDMFIIHFEKAFADVPGAYQMINQQFIIHELSDYTYVNREEDMGLEGLRKAKESYYPSFMAEKGVIIK
ncbi:MAG: phosphatidylglycerol lysyltransferase domain-containing protein [Lachnospiraceae bacterium]|nr:phosphatidylglycerol lysyltransferase domain-containing protein [Lachnospiraceae bacterium]